MFRLINSHLQVCSLQVKSQDAVKNRPEDDSLLVETCSLHITLCNKNSCADLQISITVRFQALRDVFIQIIMTVLTKLTVIIAFANPARVRMFGLLLRCAASSSKCVSHFCTLPELRGI